MEFTINCTRVPIPQGTTLYGTPVDVGPAPAFSGVVSDHVAPKASNDSNTPIFLDGYHLIERGQLHILQSEKTLLAAKIVLFLALSMHAPLPLEGAYKNLV